MPRSPKGYLGTRLRYKLGGLSLSLRDHLTDDLSVPLVHRHTPHPWDTGTMWKGESKMRVKELIKQLKHMDEDEEIIAVYWTKKDVNDWYYTIDITDGQWGKLVDKFDDYDYQQTGDDIVYQLDDIIDEGVTGNE